MTISDRMHVTNRSHTPMATDVDNYPNSSHFLPVTPQLNQDRGDSDYSSDYKMTESREPYLSSSKVFSTTFLTVKKSVMKHCSIRPF